MHGWRWRLTDDHCLTPVGRPLRARPAEHEPNQAPGGSSQPGTLRAARHVLWCHTRLTQHTEVRGQCGARRTRRVVSGEAGVSQALPGQIRADP
jgi:hypothetical protein